jgi:hypothetical protein
MAELGDIFNKRSEGAQDWNLCVHVIEKAKRVGHIPFFLYHWRMRPGSLAIDVRAKPYTVEARYNVLSDFFSRQDPPLALARNYELKFIDRALASKVATFALEPSQLIGASLSQIANLISHDDSTYLNFQIRGSSQISGELELLACYASLKSVACVFPFQEGGMRAAYTLKDKTLVPVTHSRSNFSLTLGNVLAGPTQGCTIQVAKLKQLLKEGVRLLGDYRLATPEELGPILSLLALQRGWRSVCVPKNQIDNLTTVVRVPELLLPKMDPFL